MEAFPFEAFWFRVAGETGRCRKRRRNQHSKPGGFFDAKKQRIQRMSDRTFFVRLNLDDMAAEVVGLESSEERGQWLDGFLVGSRGKDAREGWPEPKQDGHRFGLSCHHEAESFREKKAAAGEASANARRGRYGSAQPNTARTPLEQCSNTARTSAEQTPNHPTSNIQHPTTIIQKRSTSNESPLDPPRGKRFVPPTEPEWVAYCEQTWADWHPECSAEAWAYYESKGWKIGSATCKDWKAAARTAHGNARAWGKLQPVAGATRPTNSPGSPPPPRQMTPEEQRRLRGHRMDLERAERDLRVARNYPHNYDVDEARRKVDEVKARILKMGADPDAKP